MAFVIPALLLISLNLLLSPAFATRPVPSVNIATMASSEEVPEQIVSSLCKKTKDPTFCHNFAKGDMQTFLGMDEAVRTKVLTTAIEITSAVRDEFSEALKEKQQSPQEKPAIQNCIALYTKVENSLRSSASTSADFNTIGHQLQVAGESLWQCQMALHSHPNNEAIAVLKLNNGLTNSFISYVQSEFYAHYLQLTPKH